jgi:hypothetical protein
MVEPYLGHPKHGDQQANNRTEQSRSLLVSADFGNQIDTIADSKITCDYIGRTAVDPASNGRARDLQFWE